MSRQQKIIEGLTKSYWAEIETVMNYIAHSVNLDGVRAEEIKKSLTAEVADELLHAQSLAKRIKELGGLTPGSKDFKPGQTTLQPGPDTTDVMRVIKGVIDAETMAVQQYKDLIKLCEGEDYVTQDLCIRSLADEESHKAMFEGFLKEYTKGR
ncbi:MAG: ferritin-like domain-containing protein [Candidatus Omnitrophota bacterium]|nr:ferritin-like domain-containing protein [Candidatus Omnitrophota bacterium]MDZ4243369.1 ferritin-like domain-containing protein [Candidatus Omnitrophota bacterium]